MVSPNWFEFCYLAKIIIAPCVSSAVAMTLEMHWGASPDTERFPEEPAGKRAAEEAFALVGLW